MPIAWRSLCASRLRPSMKSSKKSAAFLRKWLCGWGVTLGRRPTSGSIFNLTTNTIHFEAARRRENHSRVPTSDDGRLIAVSWGVDHFTQAAAGYFVDEAAGHHAFRN